MDSPTTNYGESMMIASPTLKIPVLSHHRHQHENDNDDTNMYDEYDDYDINHDIDFSHNIDDICDSDTESSDGTEADFDDDDDDDASSYTKNNNKKKKKNENETDDIGNGLFLSLEMVKLLRKSASEGNLGNLLPQSLIDSMTPTPRVTPTNTTTNMSNNKFKPLSNHSSMVFAIQPRDPTKHNSVHAQSKNETHPKETLQQIFKTNCNIRLQFQKYDSVPDDYFVKSHTGASSSSYTQELMTAVRDNDMATIQHLHEVLHCPLQCANKFQESIIHTVARRGYKELLMYLTTVAQVSVRVCCDGGRNALHDACWTSEPNLDMIQIIISDSPDLLYLSDRRNNTPLDYIPKDAYAVWNTWLHQNAHLLKPKVLSFQEE